MATHRLEGRLARLERAILERADSLRVIICRFTGGSELYGYATGETEIIRREGETDDELEDRAALVATPRGGIIALEELRREAPHGAAA